MQSNVPFSTASIAATPSSAISTIKPFERNICDATCWFSGLSSTRSIFEPASVLKQVLSTLFSFLVAIPITCSRVFNRFPFIIGFKSISSTVLSSVLSVSLTCWFSKDARIMVFLMSIESCFLRFSKMLFCSQFKTCQSKKIKS